MELIQAADTLGFDQQKQICITSATNSSWN